MVGYTLDDTEVGALRDLAQRRNQDKVSKGIESNVFGIDNVEGHYLHAVGMYVVAQLLELPMDWSVSPHGNKAGYDFTVPNTGETIDVITRPHHTHELAFAFDNVMKITANITVLVRKAEGMLPPNSWEAVGWIATSRMRVPKDLGTAPYRIDDFGKGRRIVVPPESLMRFEALMARVDQARKKRLTPA